MATAPKRWVIIPAGGIGARTGLPYPKQLLPLGNTTVLEQTLSLFAGWPVYVAVPSDHYAVFEEKIGTRAQLVRGGATRFQSVRNAFEALPDPDDEDLVLIHDAARPFLDPATLEQAWALAEREGAVIYAVAATDTLKEVAADGSILQTLDRERVVHAQTPQIFWAGWLRQAYARHDAGNAPPPTDEARLLEGAGFPVRVFPSRVTNRKLTHKEDFLPLRTTRVGHGYDVHPFASDRPLYLGGVRIPGGPGLAGHSDADAAIHALVDALLGAAGMGDIGGMFPDHDPKLKDIRSTLLLEKAWRALQQKGYAFLNADLTIVAQFPRLAPHIQAMREQLASLLGTSPDNINIKATTTEGLGFVGRKEGLAAHATVLLSHEGRP